MISDWTEAMKTKPAECSEAGGGGFWAHRVIPGSQRPSIWILGWRPESCGMCALAWR